MRALALFAVLGLSATARADDPIYLHAELDPLTFANGGYGGQVGVRDPHLHGVRLAVASFSLHVPDPISQLGGNAKFDVDIRPSGAFYALYYPRPAGEDGFAFGASFRLLRIAYQRDDLPDMGTLVTEISPEAIVGYQWHPFHNELYLQPWLALGVTVWRNHDARVGDRVYAEPPVSPFFTVNIGWEQAL